MKRRWLVTAVTTLTAAATLGACGQVGPGDGRSPGASSTPAARTPSPSASPSAASPTGRIAFSRPEGPEGSGRVHVYVVDAGGGAPTRLTNDDLVEESLHWLTDGSRLVYAWSRFEDPYHGALRSILPDGSDPRDLGNVFMGGYSGVSPNGRSVIFSGNGSDDGTNGLVLLDLVTGMRRQLTVHGEADAIWSPDGTRILAISPNRGIVIVEAAFGTAVRIPDVDVDAVYGWTEDGRSVVYMSCADDLGKDACMAKPPVAARFDGTDVRPYLGPLPAPSDTRRWSPDGRWIASWTETRLLVTPAPGGDAVQLANGGPAFAWSPDSEWLVFAAPTVDPAGAGNDDPTGLYIVHRDGGAPIQLTDQPYDQNPAWGP